MPYVVCYFFKVIIFVVVLFLFLTPNSATIFIIRIVLILLLASNSMESVMYVVVGNIFLLFFIKNLFIRNEGCKKNWNWFSNLPLSILVINRFILFLVSFGAFVLLWLSVFLWVGLLVILACRLTCNMHLAWHLRAFQAKQGPFGPTLRIVWRTNTHSVYYKYMVGGNLLFQDGVMELFSF